MKKFKPKFLTIEEIQEKMRHSEPMPTAIFSTKKMEYIVKARTIYANSQNYNKSGIKW